MIGWICFAALGGFMAGVVMTVATALWYLRFMKQKLTNVLKPDFKKN